MENKPLKVLLIEDNLGDASLLREMLVDLHGGQMMVQSEVGVSTTFTIWLPLTD